MTFLSRTMPLSPKLRINRSIGQRFPLPLQGMLILPRAKEFAIGIPGRIDLDALGGIRSCPGRRPVRIMHDGTPVILGRQDELQSSTYRLDPKLSAVLFNESSHLRNGRSSST